MKKNKESLQELRDTNKGIKICITEFFLKEKSKRARKSVHENSG